MFSCAPTGGCSLLPIDLGPDSDSLYLELYGTGIRGSPVTARIGPQPVEAVYAGALAATDGVDQVNLRIPRPFLLRGYQPLTVSAAGRDSSAVTLWLR